MIVFPTYIQIKKWNKRVHRAVEVVTMSRRDLKNLKKMEDIWDEEFEEKFEFFNPNDVMEEFQNK